MGGRERNVGGGHVPALLRFGAQNARSAFLRSVVQTAIVGIPLAASVLKVWRKRTQRVASLRVGERFIVRA